MKSLAIAAIISCLAAGSALAQDPAMERLQQAFDTADSNGNNAISYDEFLAFRAAQWVKLDRNGDGQLSEKDFPRVAAKAARSRLNDIKSFDTNGDGVISRAEFVNGPTPSFDMTDTDANGMLSRNEVSAAATKTRS